MFDRAAEIIALIVGPPGRPPDQPRTGLVVDRVKRAAKMQADARILYRPWSPRISRPIPQATPPPPRGGEPCPRCCLPRPTCCCPTR
jgi:hypothetical protein